MPMGRASTRTVGNSILFSSRVKTKGIRMQGMAVSILFRRTQVLWVSRLRSHEIGVSYISQEHWEE